MIEQQCDIKGYVHSCDKEEDTDDATRLCRNVNTRNHVGNETRRTISELRVPSSTT